MADTPHRIQRLRTKGWRLLEGAVTVSRPSKWGNPWKAEVVDGVGWCCADAGGRIVQARDRQDAHDLAVGHFRAWLAKHPSLAAEARAELRGRVLCCWCPPDVACHADVLLAIANAPEEPDA
ncbi:DUF4326 domain-containing protein [Roseomonas frigidaquae]|uniref:DUF4326 domain-containing protein n=1 Tax=Falsiroseomonas frigidaquae TaxID=487318 RepID=A0ABX1ES18_9PROT|nr:DUF4326 domain-containing protein [Falsiroseomonas frigidaquae]NKE43420.1 DUF4326 domain-containing protein [Falsiroseomonas frigidaquae]